LAVWLQAQQEIPDWLEALAAGSYGSGGFTSNASQCRDLRRGNVRISFECLVYSVCTAVQGVYNFWKSGIFNSSLKYWKSAGI